MEKMMDNIKEKVKKIKKEQLIIFSVGLVIGLLTMVVFYPERIAELKNGEEVAIKVGKTDITADSMYTDMKDKYALNSILEIVDRTILDKKYETNEEVTKGVEETAQSYLNYYSSQMGYTEEQFLESQGFKDLDEFKYSLELEYKRNMYYQEYMLDNVTESEIDDYYNNMSGVINTEHILVKNEVENANEKATEILNKLKNGTSWEDLKNEYKSVITTENVKVDFDSNLESNYINATKKLKDGAYTNELVKTSYGYHIILRVSTEEKLEKKDLTERIKKAIVNVKQTEDTKMYEKVMVKMRELEGMEIKDTKLKEVYEDYVKKYTE